MRVNVVSDTIQEFNGERFYLCGKYFQHKGRRLHVVVWKYHNGEIPKKYNVHHKDLNRSNNQIENLEIKLASVHLSDHGKSAEREEYNQRHIKDMRELAAKWHGSEEGRAWHSKHEKEMWAKRIAGEKFVCKCSECGEPFETFHTYGEGQNMFCSNRCKSNFRRKSGADNVERVCSKCGTVFVCNKYSKAKTCSRQCASDLRWGK